MLAVSRTPSNTRIYFRTKDAALFRAMEKGLFDEPSSSEVSQEGWDKMIEVWKNTVDCQKLHEDNTDVDWDEPLCFALSITMARNQKSSDNGLFPGKLDQQGSPCMYKDEFARDNLWGVTFKIPYLLWKHSSSLGIKPEIVKGSQETSPIDDTKSQSSKSSSQPEFNRKILPLLKDLTQRNREKNDKKASSSSMKHHFPQDALNMSKTTDDTPILGVLIDVPKAGKGAEHQMANFHQSHTSFEKHFEEETVEKLNTWTTELHLSFYDILEGNKSQKEPQDTGDLSLPPTEAKLVDTFLTRVSTSFHIEGGFFDGYWTCRYWELDQHGKKSDGSHTNSLDVKDLELLLAEVEERPDRITQNEDDSKRAEETRTHIRTHIRTLQEDDHSSITDEDRSQRSTEPDMHISRTVVEAMMNLMLKTEKKPTAQGLQKGPWQRRRVLELLIVRRILKKMLKSSDKILKMARSSIEKVFQQVQDVLQMVEGDLAENLAQMELWRTREKDRQAEKPRWTLNDENRYRVIIVKLRVSNEHDVQKLKRIHLEIASLNELLAKRLEVMRNDLEQRRANDTQKFTYVTVVFLPLGFATGVFSMSGTPLVSMVFTAIVSLVVTALMLGVTQAFDSRTLTKWRKQAIEAEFAFPKNLQTIQKKKKLADPERADASRLGGGAGASRERRASLERRA
ncbi:hypothetical protein CPAR01_13586 [Colletotrichum paranaense]|uniref:CorA-like Mg2+ transporter n=1 Tax=Colletotrichum paranaense TaxID=1914294 RepID=A0ABQ9S489_9PEZI|nr:uncharacterized protein CPAR01_13586 [Colletotrichum paranaense]KAK1524638.1 hypothetical protein CPAR01_13586 [Colletotrichum paranaense]